MCCPVVGPSSFFQDGLKAVDILRPSVDKLASDLTAVRCSGVSCLLPDMTLRYQPDATRNVSVMDASLLLWSSDQADTGRREETADTAPGCPEGVAAV